MRAFLIVLVLLALFATGWHAAFQGTEVANLRGAPQIERDIHRGAIRIVAAAGGEPVEVRTSGRNVMLTGPVESDGKRQALLAEIAKLPLVVSVLDDTTVLDRADPYTLEVVRTPDGMVTIVGFVPNRRAEDRLLAQARDLGAGARVSADISLATGAPAGNWVGMVSTGLRAMQAMTHGALRISGNKAVLTGETADAAGLDRITEMAEREPLGEWSLNVSVAPPADGYLFSATVPDKGAVAIAGHGPDIATIRGLEEAASRRTGRELSGNLVRASGMPGPAWPQLVRNALAALGKMEAGSLEVRDWAVKISGTVDTDADKAALSRLLDEDWEVAITVRNPTPPGNVTVLLTTDGNVRVTGLLPEGLSIDDIERALPDADTSGIEREARGKPANWTGALEGLSIVVPRFAELEVIIAGRTLGAKGLLKPDFSADGVHAALRSALDRDWALSVRALERRPLAEVTLSLTDGKALISGVLPVGISPEQALAIAGDGASGIGLAGGGDGDVSDWRAALRSILTLLPIFNDLTGKISESRVDLQGRLKAGYALDVVQRRLREGVPQSWDIEVSAAETPASEGDRRNDLETGRNQTFRNGFWLPDVDFPVSSERCGAEIDRVMANNRFIFIYDGSELEQTNDRLLNSLAAIAVRCLNSSDLRMEVSSHTASVGNDAENRRLTEQRAQSVAEALRKRGVRDGGIVAIGRGEEAPIATNDTPEGRARNQRIAFRWLGADE